MIERSVHGGDAGCCYHCRSNLFSYNELCKSNVVVVTLVALGVLLALSVILNILFIVLLIICARKRTYITIISLSKTGFNVFILRSTSLTF